MIAPLVSATYIRGIKPGNAARPLTVLKNRHNGNAAAAQKVGFKGNNTLAAGAFATPYIPLQMTDITMADTTCVTCGSPGKPVAVQGKNEIRDVVLCPTCQKTMNIMDWIFSGPLELMFPEINTREDCGDNIIWRVPAGTRVWPVYAKTGVDQQDIFYVPKVGMSLDRDYFCHDSFLYKDTVDCITTYKGGYGLTRGSELYVYQFHKIVNDGTGWAIGFILDGKHLLAHDVEMTDDELA